MRGDHLLKILTDSPIPIRQNDGRFRILSLDPSKTESVRDVTEEEPTDAGNEPQIP